jgi:hypothetical protein
MRSLRLTAALAGAGVSWDQVASCRSLTGGTFNAVHLVGLADGTGLVVKIPPGPDTPLLRYEQGILGLTAAGACFRLEPAGRPMRLPPPHAPSAATAALASDAPDVTALLSRDPPASYQL